MSDPGPRLPHALEAFDDLRLGDRPIVGLDFDGTLSRIVETPADAEIPEPTREAVRRLAAAVPVVVVSGRDAGDVRARIGVPVAAYAGSHGFDIVAGDGETFPDGPAARFASLLPTLDRIEERLRGVYEDVEGIIVERKRFGVATHFRRAPGYGDDVREVTARMADEHPDLKLLEGKAVAEIRPAADWDKGRALDWLVDRLGPATGVLYVGDDTTDEDAFRAIADRGVGVLVAEEPRPTAASFRVADPAEVRALIERLAERYS